MTIFLSPTLWILTLYMISTTFSSSGLFFGFFNTLSLLSGHLPLTKEITMKNRHNEICLWQMQCTVELQWSPQSTPQTLSWATSNKSVSAQDSVHEGHNVHSHQWCKLINITPVFEFKSGQTFLYILLLWIMIHLEKKYFSYQSRLSSFSVFGPMNFQARL